MTKRAINVLFSIIALNVAATSFNAFQTHKLYRHFVPNIAVVDSTDSVSVGNQQEWEYKVVSINNYYTFDKQIFTYNLDVKYPKWQSTVTKYTNQGWELISATPLIETEYPDFSEAGNVLGIKSFVYTKEVRFIFKRRY